MMDLTIRTYMAIMAERDAAIQERNMSLDERKRAFAERDMAMLQRDAAISERNSAIQERDEAITALRLLEESMNENRNQQQIMPSESRYYPPRENENGNEKEETDYFNFEEVASETAAKPKARRGKRTKSGKSAAKLVGGSRDNIDDEVSEDDENKLNRIMFDETIMPTPVCTCTGAPQPCYRWGNGGWQSACCTTAISMYPLPQVSNKRYTRIGGRKMSGSAFSKLLNRIASEGYSLSAPLDLKDHWAKHGTNRYTIAK